MINNIPFSSFNHKASRYDAYNAYLLAFVSQASYRDEADADNTAWTQRLKQDGKTWGFNRVETFDNQGSQAIILADSQKILVGFRGSEEKSDWEHNLNKIQDSCVKKHIGASIHSGFLEYLNNIWNPYSNSPGMEAILREEIKNKPRTLWITGHSLGGAAATLCAAFCLLETSPIPVSGLYTYGQPRVGDKKFADWFNKKLQSKTFRFVNHKDIVPQVPTWSPINFFYYHIGTRKYLTETGEITDVQDTDWSGAIRDKYGYLFQQAFAQNPPPKPAQNLDNQLSIETKSINSLLKETMETTEAIRQLIQMQTDISCVFKEAHEKGFEFISDHSLTNGYMPPLRKALPNK